MSIRGNDEEVLSQSIGQKTYKSDGVFVPTVVVQKSRRSKSSRVDIAVPETGVFVQDAFIAGTRNRNVHARDAQYAAKKCRIVNVTSILILINR